LATPAPKFMNCSQFIKVSTSFKILKSTKRKKN